MSKSNNKEADDGFQLCSIFKWLSSEGHTVPQESKETDFITVKAKNKNDQKN